MSEAPESCTSHSVHQPENPEAADVLTSEPSDRTTMEMHWKRRRRGQVSMSAVSTLSQERLQLSLAKVEELERQMQDMRLQQVTYQSS